MKRGTMFLLGGLALGGGVFWWLNRKKKAQPEPLPVLRPDRLVSPKELGGSGVGASAPGSPTPMHAINMLSQRAVELDDAKQLARQAGNDDLALTIDAEQRQVMSDLNSVAEQVAPEIIKAATPVATPPQGPLTMPEVIRPAEPTMPSPAARVAQPTAMTTAVVREPASVSTPAPMTTAEPPQAPLSPPPQPAIVAVALPSSTVSGVYKLDAKPRPAYSVSRQFPTVSEQVITYASGVFKLPQGGSWTLEGVYMTEGGFGEGPMEKVFVHWVNSSSNDSVWFSVPYNVKALLDEQEAIREAQDAAEAAPQRGEEAVTPPPIMTEARTAAPAVMATVEPTTRATQMVAPISTTTRTAAPTVMTSRVTTAATRIAAP